MRYFIIMLIGLIGTVLNAYLSKKLSENGRVKNDVLRIAIVVSVTFVLIVLAVTLFK